MAALNPVTDNPYESMDRRSDEDLALALQDGDRAAFDELVRRHQGRVYAVAYRLSGNREDALDIAQEALFKAYRKADSWSPTGSFVAWLLRLTANLALDQLRRQKRRPTDRWEDGYTGETLETGALEGVTERAVRGAEIDERITAALSTLSPSQRTAFVMRHYEGHALSDIAPVLGCTVGSVKVHLFRALRKLRVELRDLYED